MTGEAATLTGRVLVFGGPYGNLEATVALLAAGRRLGIAPANILCTGDVVAYCADPQGVVDLLRGAGIRVVMGNCEEALAAGAGDCGCGFADGSACSIASMQWFAYVDRAIDADTRAWMGRLPRRIDLTIDRRRLVAIHGGIEEINRFVFATSDAAIADELAAAPADGVIAGHCGLPFTRAIGGRLWHNAGVIGMPANDGTPRAWFSVLTPIGDGTGLAIEHHALDYDHATAARKMRARGLPEGYAVALETGLWPSCDVLTAPELRRRGRALAPGRALWRDGSADCRWPLVDAPAA